MMTQDELQHLFVDANYIFTFTDGHTERHRGSWLIMTDNVGWKMNMKKVSQIIEYQQIKQINKTQNPQNQ